jgi:hypothetical protein
MAKAEVSAVKAAAKAVLKAVSGLHPDAALELLAPLQAEAEQGHRHRVLLAARIALMRKAMVAPRRVVAVALPVAEQEVVAPPPPPPPKPEPKPLSKGRIMAINLDDLSSMLAEPVEPAPKPAEEPVPDFAPLDWGEVAAVVASEAGESGAPVAEGAGTEAGVAGPAKPGKASRGKKRGAVVAIKDGADLADPFAALAELGDSGAVVPMAAGAAMVDPIAAFAELEAAEFPSGGVAVANPAAVFVALAEAGEAVPKAETEMDPLAVLAELEGAEDAAEDRGTADVATVGKSQGKAAVVDAGAAFAALEEARDAEVGASVPTAGKPKPLAIDLSAQFAAMGDGE